MAWGNLNDVLPQHDASLIAMSCTSQSKAARVALEGRRCSPASSPLALGGPRASLGRTAGSGACQAFFTFFTARFTLSFTCSATRATLSFTCSAALSAASFTSPTA